MPTKVHAPAAPHLGVGPISACRLSAGPLRRLFVTVVPATSPPSSVADRATVAGPPRLRVASGTVVGTLGDCRQSNAGVPGGMPSSRASVGAEPLATPAVVATPPDAASEGCPGRFCDASAVPAGGARVLNQTGASAAPPPTPPSSRAARRVSAATRAARSSAGGRTLPG